MYIKFRFFNFFTFNAPKLFQKNMEPQKHIVFEIPH